MILLGGWQEGLHLEQINVPASGPECKCQRQRQRGIHPMQALKFVLLVSSLSEQATREYLLQGLRKGHTGTSILCPISERGQPFEGDVSR